MIIRIAAGILIGILFFYFIRFATFVLVVIVNIISDLFR